MVLAILAVVGLGGLLIASLAIPVELQARATLEDELDAGLRVRWLFGLVERDVSAPERGSGGQPRSLPRRAQLELLWRKPFRDRVARLYARCRPAIQIGTLSGRARIGLGDPADTGRAMGVLLPLCAALSLHPKVELNLDTDWSQAAVVGRVHGEVRVIPLGLVRPVVAFALSREVIGTVRAWRRSSS